MYEEDFGTSPLSKDEKFKIADFKGWSNTTVKYSDQYTKADIRTTGTIVNNHVWLPTTGNSELAIEGINTEKASKLKISFDVATGTSKDFDLQNLAIIFNDQTFNPESKIILAADANKFINVTVDLSTAKTLSANSKLSFFSDITTNKAGLRIDNIILKGQK